MKRRLFSILSALSLLLCVAVCVLWVRSYFVADSLRGLWQQNLNDTALAIDCDSGSFHASLYLIHYSQRDPKDPTGRRPGGMFYFSRNAYHVGTTSFATTKLTAPLNMQRRQIANRTIK